MLRYEMGPQIGLNVPGYPVQPPTDGPKLEDVRPEIAGLTNEGVVLSFPPYDPTTHVAPSEVRAYFVKVEPGGQAPPTPGSIQEWFGSTLPVSIAVEPILPDGTAVYPLPLPGGLTVPGDYLVQTVLGYDDSATWNPGDAYPADPTPTPTPTADPTPPDPAPEAAHS